MNYGRVLLVVLSLAFIASAAEKATIRVRVLDSETHSVVVDDSGVPKNCDQVNFDAYCNNSKTTQVTNTLLVQEGNQPPFRVRCSVDARWSRCVPLPKGEAFDARREKHGLLVYYEDDKGKARSQLYTLLSGSLPQAPTDAATPQPAASAMPASQLPASPAPASTPSAPAPSVAASNASENADGNVKCNFSSTPSGADITVDGKYVGSTPSEIAVSVGTHVVTISLPGFAEWKRDLAIMPGSGVINVAASLQKTP
jgi:hypothetical protein